MSSYLDSVKQGISDAMNPLYVDETNAVKDPSSVVAALTRAQWQDYITRYRPVEDTLMNQTSYNNPGIVDQQVNNAIGSAGLASQVVQDARTVNRAQYGISERPGMSAAETRSDNLALATAEADAANRTRTNIIDRNRMIAVGSIPNSGRAYGLSTQ